ncbi:MAG: protein kinase, partial [Polyangiaceae bacterium]
LADGRHFYVMDLLDGEPLDRWLKHQGRVDLPTALRLLTPIAGALDLAHGAGIVHRDLKPENVMLVEKDDGPDFVKVLDFGIAKLEPHSSRDTTQPLTRLGAILGTPEYMAPEQALGQPVDPRADIYSLGIIGYEMLAGVRPFDHASKVTLLGMHVTAAVPPISVKAPEAIVPHAVEAILMRMLAKESTHRYADSKELSDAIDDVWLPDYGNLPGAPVNSARGGSLSGPLGNASTARVSIANYDPSTALPIITGPRPVWDPLVNKAHLLYRERPRLLLYLGLATSAFIALVIFVAVLSGAGKGTKVDDDAGVAAIPSTSAKPVDKDLEAQVTEAVEETKKGNYATGIAKLSALEESHPERADIHRELEKAYVATHATKDSMREAELWLKVDPKAIDDLKLLEDVRNTAIGKDAADAAFALLETQMGWAGPDILYDIAYGQSGAQYPLAASRAQKSLVRAEVRALAKPALQVTISIRTAGGCDAKKAHFAEASEVGDARTITALKPYAARKGCGFVGSRDCWPCMHKDGSLEKTISAIEERTH